MHAVDDHDLYPRQYRSTPPCDFTNSGDCLLTPVSLLPEQPPSEAEDLEDITLHHAPSGDLTACMSWYKCSSLTSPSIIKISLLPVVSPPFTNTLTTSRSDIPVSSYLSRSSVVIPSLSTNICKSLEPLLLIGQDHPSNSTTPYSRRTTDPCSIDSPPSITSRETKSSINLTEDWDPVLDMTFGTSSIEPRSILSYGIMGTLGRGSYGKVLLAYLKTHPDGDLYAVKILRKPQKIQHDNVALAGELNTLQMVANSSSYEDNIYGGLFLQRLVDHFQDDGFHFIIMEYHPTTLSDPETASRFLVREHVTLSASISLPLAGKECRSSSIPCEHAASSLRLLAAEISLGLLFLHNNGIVHQDIKPANIMISSAGHAVIGDFGAASRLPSLESRSSLAPLYTGFNNHNRAIILKPDDFITFTPLYAAPEIRERNLEGLVVYDERADWWSLGVLLYELVTGYAPFNPSSRVSTFRRLRRSDGDHSLSFGRLEKLSLSWKAHEDCCMYLESFLRSLLLHNPNDRLSGQDVLRHHFFGPIQALWDEIVALEHPPCPNPPISRVDDDVSLDFNSSYETHSEKGEFENRMNVSRPVSENDSIHCFHDGLLDEEAVRDQRHSADESDTSLLQAMPSSASIWFIPAVDPASNSDRLTRDVNGSTLHISIDTLNVARSSVITVDTFFSAQLASTPQPHLRDNLGQRTDWPGRPFPFQRNESSSSCVILPKDVTLPEKITMSLLDAMDIRDRREVILPIRIDKEKQTISRPSIFSSRKLIKATWKKLHFW